MFDFTWDVKKDLLLGWVVKPITQEEQTWSTMSSERNIVCGLLSLYQAARPLDSMKVPMSRKVTRMEQENERNCKGEVLCRLGTVQSGPGDKDKEDKMILL